MSETETKLRAALAKAREFIVNGIELGFIRMPDPGTPNTAHQTLPMIEAALAIPSDGWRTMESAPKDGTWIIVFAPGELFGLSDIVCPCQWHPDAGFCVCELREPTHWKPLPAQPRSALDGK